MYVPVRIGPAGCVPRLFRTGARRRTAVAFTTRTRLLAALGGEQTWIRLSEAVLRSLTEPLDGVGVLVDPRPVQATAAESPTR
ncbi:hypothetical protein HCC30_07155 [Streptomyces sp. HNM0574]|nr:hypothetical protein [Streptomyces sp. HNM0574]